MKVNVKDKLRIFLKKPVKNEASLVYVLVEVRKILDRSDKTYRNRFPTLYFFCNWILHTKMDRTPAVRILKKFDNALEKGENLLEASMGFSLFFSFFDELIIFLKDQKLPSNWISITTNNLDNLLVDILSHIPLENPVGYVQKYVIGRLKRHKRKSFMVVFVLRDGNHKGWTITRNPKMTKSEIEKWVKKNKYTVGHSKYKSPLLD